MRNTDDRTGGKPIAVLLQSISGVSAINPLVAFYDIHGGKTEELFFYFVPDTTRDNMDKLKILIVISSLFRFLSDPLFLVSYCIISPMTSDRREWKKRTCCADPT
jgi:hypothetical protein